MEVFEPTTQPNAFNVANHALILQANGSDLMVGEEYMITNKTQPPVAFYREDGSFNFNLPDGAQFGQASAWGAANMPVVQGTIDKGKDKMAIAFPFRPGESGVRLAYKLPYPGNHLMLRNVSPYATERLIIAAPPTMKVAGSGISPAGQDQGFNVYTMDRVAANTPVDITVSGTAPHASDFGRRSSRWRARRRRRQFAESRGEFTRSGFRCRRRCSVGDRDGDSSAAR